MFTIGEFSRLTKVSPRMLRYYEKAGLFYPATLDKTNGYRIYTAEQIPLLLRIVSLRDMGYSVEEIIDFVDHRDDQAFLVYDLRRKQDDLERDIAQKQAQIQSLADTIVRLEHNNASVTCDTVQLKRYDAFKATTLVRSIDDYRDQESLWAELAAIVEPDDFSNPALSIYHGYDEASRIKLEIGFISSNGNRIVEAMDAVSVVCRGPLEHVLPEGEAACVQWASDHGYTIIGPEHVINTQHPMNQENADLYRTEILFPVRKKENDTCKDATN